MKYNVKFLNLSKSEIQFHEAFSLAVEWTREDTTSAQIYIGTKLILEVYGKALPPSYLQQRDKYEYQVYTKEGYTPLETTHSFIEAFAVAQSYLMNPKKETVCMNVYYDNQRLMHMYPDAVFAN